MPRPGENSKLEELDMTKEELNKIKEAFEKEEFRKMFAEYIDEVNDPKNKAIYEKEITQLEKERGVDITFVYPNPGYVIKTSVDGKQKAFINVCQNDNVGKPSSCSGRRADSFGTEWSVPYIQAAPRIDLDKARNRCLVYDVVFHPDALDLAKTSASFKQLVDDTALTAVEDNYKVKLDRKNIRFPKMAFKGAKHATVIRRKSAGSGARPDPDDVFEIPNYPYKPLKEDPVPIVTRVKTDSDTPEPYTTPAYVIKHRKGVDMHEFSNALDSKIHAATPTELLIVIDLPLIKSASDVALDVSEKSLSLTSEKPAKYKLNIKLPWCVNEDNGSAKFDKSTKKLHVTLPVQRQNFRISDLVREDSGIESDHNPSIKSSSEEDISECVEVLEEKKMIKDNFRTSETRVSELEKECFFLDPKLHYSFPSFALNTRNDRLAVMLDVQNVDSSSVKHRMVDDNKGVHICLTSVGSGFFPINYAFCIKIPGAILDRNSVDVDVSEDNLVLHIKIASTVDTSIKQCFVGTSPESLTEHFFSEPIVIANVLKEIKVKKESSNLVEPSENPLTLLLSDLNIGEVQSPLDEDSVVNCKTKPSDETSIPVESPSMLINSGTAREVTVKKNYHFENSTSEQFKKQCDSETEVEAAKSQIKLLKDKFKTKKHLSSKSRTQSVSLVPATVSGRRSILKCNRSLSESNVDDYSAWSSVDSSDSCIPEEIANGMKKTVRFSDIITQKYFRANSSILGQRKKNQRKTRNKKKSNERRLSESEASASEGEMTGSEIEASDTSASDISDASSDTSEVEENLRPPEILPSSKKHRRRGQKNRRKNASTAKHNMVLHAD